MGDEAPYSTERDQLLALQPAKFLDWFFAMPHRVAVAADLTKLFHRLREAVLPVEDFPVPGDLDRVLAVDAEIEARASGRSQSHIGLADKKRLAYVLRLAHGERLFRRLSEGAAVDKTDASLREGIRAIHDLTVPRVHMEVTICGALPPFNAALAGKLVVSFLAHPSILEATKGTPGQIVQSVFDIERIDGLLPDAGVIAITTKGLYPGHSALYNRAAVPGLDARPVRLRKLGDTRGESTMLMGERTARLAKRVVEGARESGRVALAYGTGGSKRMRFLESAAVESGLSQRIVHAGIRRPVYGLRLVSNLPEVIWCRAQPHWVVDTSLSAEDYSDTATALWRTQWGDRASAAALSHSSVVPGMISVLTHED